MNIPEEAVRAAALSITYGTVYDINVSTEIARAALSAAAPHLMAMAWDEGFSAAWQERDNPDPFVNDEWDAKTANPYKEAL